MRHIQTAIIINLAILTSLFLSGCTNSIQSKFYEPKGLKGNPDCFFKGCWGVTIKGLPQGVLELERAGHINSIPVYYGVTTSGGGSIGGYEFRKDQNSFVYLKDFEESTRVEYHVQKDGQTLILYNADEKFALSPIRVFHSATTVFGVLGIAAFLLIVIPAAWQMRDIRLPTFLVADVGKTKALSSLLIGCAWFLSLSKNFPILEGEFGYTIAFLLAAIFLSALGIYLYAAAYHLVTGWFGGSGSREETVTTFYRWLIILALITLYYHSIYLILSIDFFTGRGWSTMQVISYLAGYRLDHIIRLVEFFGLFWGFCLFTAKTAEARKISFTKSFWILASFNILFEISGFAYI